MTRQDFDPEDFARFRRDPRNQELVDRILERMPEIPDSLFPAGDPIDNWADDGGNMQYEALQVGVNLLKESMETMTRDEQEWIEASSHPSYWSSVPTSPQKRQRRR